MAWPVTTANHMTGMLDLHEGCVVHYHRVGLEDHVICVGLLMYLSNVCSQVYATVHRHDLAGFSSLHSRGGSGVGALVVDSYHELEEEKIRSIIGHDRFSVLRLGLHKLRSNGDILSRNVSYPQLLYADAGIPYETRWSHFGRSRDLVREQAARAEAGLPKEYAFVMEDSAAGIYLDWSEIPEIHMFNPFDFMRVRNYTIFDLGLILEGATIIHAVDSAITHYAEHLNLSAERLVIHAYTQDRGAAQEARVGLYWTPWEVMTAPVGASHLGLRIDYPQADQILFADSLADVDLLISIRPWAFATCRIEAARTVGRNLRGDPEAPAEWRGPTIWLGTFVTVAAAAGSSTEPQSLSPCRLELRPSGARDATPSVLTDDGRCALSLSVSAAELGLLPGGGGGAVGGAGSEHHQGPHTIMIRVVPEGRVHHGGPDAAVTIYLFNHAALPALSPARLAAAASAAGVAEVPARASAKLKTQATPAAASDTAARAAIEGEYRRWSNRRSAICEHLPLLRQVVIGLGAATVAELGVVGGDGELESSYALAAGLLASPAAGPKTWVGVDVRGHSRVERFVGQLTAAGVRATFVQGDSVGAAALAGLPGAVDVLFVDSWHVYGQLKRELAAHHARVCGVIMIHDTSIDGEESETRRSGRDPYTAAEEAGFEVEEVLRGLWPAVTEFLATHPAEWALAARLHNNNGLTILRRTAGGPCAVRTGGEQPKEGQER